MFLKEPDASNIEKTGRELPVDAEIYVHQRLGLRVIFGSLHAGSTSEVLHDEEEFCDVPSRDRSTQEKCSDTEFKPSKGALDKLSPLCSTCIVVRTPCEDNSGLAHTLEHLVFMGSEMKFPHRGQLDAMASRCMSTGTNAYTATDHTVYTVTTVEFESITRHLLPAFLDHILRPKLTEESFLTEVVHMSPSNAKYHGVVFCEMEAREHTEADLLERTIKELLFPNTPYALESGGLTSEIAMLTLDRVIAYHRKYYRPSNMTIIIATAKPNDEEREALFQGLEQVLEGYSQDDGDQVVELLNSAHENIMTPLKDSVSARIEFPSSDEDNGSVVLAWRGPSLCDLKNCVALDILLTYLQENSASPLYQAFVEKSLPLASSVCFDWLSCPITGVIITFSGIPFQASTFPSAEFETNINGDEELHSCDDSTSDHESYLMDDDNDTNLDVSLSSEVSENIDDPSKISGFDALDYSQLLMETYFRDLVLNLFKEIYTKGFPDSSNPLKRVTARSKVKLLESWEEDSHQMFIETSIVSWLSLNWNTPTHVLAEHLSQRLNVLHMYDVLEEEPTQFWLDLLYNYFIKAPLVDLISVPSLKLTAENERKNENSRKKRYEMLGADQLSFMQKTLSDAIKLSQMHLPDSVLRDMPPLKLLKTVPRISCRLRNMFFHPLSQNESKIVCQFGMPVESFHEEQVINDFHTKFNWQIIHTITSFCQIRLFFDLTNLPEHLRILLVLFKNLLFECPIRPYNHGHGLPESPEYLEYASLVRLLNDSLVSYGSDVGLGGDTFSCSYLNKFFIVSAICEPCNFQLMCSLISQVLFCTVFDISRIEVFVQNLLTEITELTRDGDEMIDAIIAVKSDLCQKSNDTFLSIFTQQGFLESISESLRHIEEGEYKEKVPLGSQVPLIDKLIVDLNSIRSHILFETSASSMFQIVLPYGQSDSLTKIFETTWNQFAHSLGRGSRKSSSISVLQFPGSHWIPYSPSPRDILVIVPINGIESSYLTQIVSCQVLKSHDQYAVIILATLLSRTEGPLYSGLRGRGYLYDVSMVLHLWHGQLSFSMREAGCPDHALWFFYDLLREIDQDSAEFFTDWQVETAKACVFYQIVASQSTPTSVAEKVARLTFTGFKSLEEADIFEKSIYQVTTEDLIRVFRRYFLSFLPTSNEPKLIIMTSSEADAKSLVHSFSNHPKYPLNFAVEHVDDLFQSPNARY